MNRKLYVILPLLCLLSLGAMGQNVGGDTNTPARTAVVGEVKQKVSRNIESVKESEPVQTVLPEGGAASEKGQVASELNVTQDLNVTQELNINSEFNVISDSNGISDSNVTSRKGKTTISKNDTTSKNTPKERTIKGRKSKAISQDTTSLEVAKSGKLPPDAETQATTDYSKSSKSKAPLKDEPRADVGTLNAEWERYKIEHHLGVKGGYGMGSGRFEPGMENVYHLGLYNFGLVYMFDVPQQKYVGTIQIELEYLEKGYTYLTYRQSEEAYARDYTVIQLPILWQPYLPLSRKNTNSRFFINAGPFLNYIVNFNSTYRKYNVKTNSTLEQGNYAWNVMRDNRFEYGIAAGAGFRIGIKRFSLTIEYRYNITLSDVMKGVDEHKGNPFFRSPIDQMNISLGLNVKL